MEPASRLRTVSRLWKKETGAWLRCWNVLVISDWLRRLPCTPQYETWWHANFQILKWKYWWETWIKVQKIILTNTRHTKGTGGRWQFCILGGCEGAQGWVGRFRLHQQRQTLYLEQFCRSFYPGHFAASSWCPQKTQRPSRRCSYADSVFWVLIFADCWDL